MRIRLVVLTFIVASTATTAPAQTADSAGVLGIRAPDRVATSAFKDEASLRLFSSIRVLSEGAAAYGQLRVLGFWGPHAGLDCGCLTTNLVIAFNLDGDELSAFRLGPLLDPVVDSLTTEGAKPIAYVTYGLAGAQRSMRVEVRADRLTVSAVRPRAAGPPRPNDGW